MTSSVTYTGDMRTECIHEQSQSVIHTDAPTDNNGKGERFSPTDLVATSLASCMLTIMAMKAEAMEINFVDVRIDVTKEMVADPRRIARIGLRVAIPKHLYDLDSKSITILKKVAMACPVAKSLPPNIHIDIN